jgi:urate oxidase
VYYIAKRLPPNAAPEECALAIAKHFVTNYPKVSRCKVNVTQAPWERQMMPDGPHAHGFGMMGAAKRTAYVSYASDDDMSCTAGLYDWKLLKTTQSGYEGVRAFFLVSPLARSSPVSMRCAAALPLRLRLQPVSSRQPSRP